MPGRAELMNLACPTRDFAPWRTPPIRWSYFATAPHSDAHRTAAVLPTTHATGFRVVQRTP